jgi:rubrerythrin
MATIKVPIIGEVDSATGKIKFYDEDRGFVYYCEGCNAKVEETQESCPECKKEFTQLKLV